MLEDMGYMRLEMYIRIRRYAYTARHEHGDVVVRRKGVLDQSVGASVPRNVPVKDGDGACRQLYRLLCAHRILSP